MSIDRLHKYGRIGDHSESLFSGSHIWMAAPAQLNDPFECRPWFTYQGTDREILEVIATGFRKQNPSATRKQALAAAREVYEQRRHLVPGFWESLNGLVIKDLASNIGLYCLSEVPDNILMWSHYGADHKGYCLAFEATDSTAVFGEAQKVGYAETYPKVDFFKTSNQEQVELIFLTKFSGWKYEQEWRIVDYRAGPGLREYPPELLKGVIFGLRMPETDRDRIRKWVARRKYPVKFAQAVQNDRKFSIEIEEII
jgi:hypothetical protein